MSPAPAQIKAVIFDFAGVIGVDGYWAWLHENIPALRSAPAAAESASPEYREALQYFHEISYQVDRADLSEEQFLNKIRERCSLPAGQIRSEIISRLKIDQAVVQLIRDLRPQYKTALLSNFVFEWLDGILNQHGLYPLFDQAVISSAHAIAKPEPAIYHKTLSLLGLDPVESVFIDDRPSNVEAAEKLGLHGLVFTSADKLRSDLRGLGLQL